jgi:hypothetical protein
VTICITGTDRVDSEHPLDVGGDREAPAAAALVAQAQAGDLDRIVERHRLMEVERDPPGSVLELGEPRTVTRDVRVRSRIGRAVGPQISPVSSSRTYNTSPGGSVTGRSTRE